eukprot:gene3360-21755_t
MSEKIVGGLPAPLEQLPALNWVEAVIVTALFGMIGSIIGGVSRTLNRYCLQLGNCCTAVKNKISRRNSEDRRPTRRLTSHSEFMMLSPQTWDMACRDCVLNVSTGVSPRAFSLILAFTAFSLVVGSAFGLARNYVVIRNVHWAKYVVHGPPEHLGYCGYPVLGLDNVDQTMFDENTPVFSSSSSANASSLPSPSPAAATFPSSSSGSGESGTDFSIADHGNGNGAWDTGGKEDGEAISSGYTESLAEQCSKCVSGGQPHLVYEDYNASAYQSWNLGRFGEDCVTTRYFGLRGVVVNFSGAHAVYDYDEWCELNNTGINKTKCHECGDAVGRLTWSTGLAIYAQIIGILFGISRMKEPNNSLVLHILSSFGAILTVGSTFANLYVFRNKCKDELDHQYAIGASLGPAWHLTWSSALVNYIQFLMHLFAKHDPNIPVTAGTPFKHCFGGPNPAHHKSGAGSVGTPKQYRSYAQNVVRRGRSEDDRLEQLKQPSPGPRPKRNKGAGLGHRRTKSGGHAIDIESSPKKAQSANFIGHRRSKSGDSALADYHHNSPHRWHTADGLVTTPVRSASQHRGGIIKPPSLGFLDVAGAAEAAAAADTALSRTSSGSSHSSKGSSQAPGVPRVEEASRESSPVAWCLDKPTSLNSARSKYEMDVQVNTSLTTRVSLRVSSGDADDDDDAYDGGNTLPVRKESTASTASITRPFEEDGPALKRSTSYVEAQHGLNGLLGGGKAPSVRRHMSYVEAQSDRQGLVEAHEHKKLPLGLQQDTAFQLDERGESLRMVSTRRANPAFNADLAAEEPPPPPPPPLPLPLPLPPPPPAEEGEKAATKAGESQDATPVTSSV